MTIHQELEVYKSYIGKTVSHIIYGLPDASTGFSRIELHEGTLESVKMLPSETMIIAELKEFPNLPTNAQLLRIKDSNGNLTSLIED